VQKSWEGVYDVLGRNFLDSGGLAWWLRRIGLSELSNHKRKDYFDYIRVVANRLHNILRAEAGRSVPRF